MKFYYSKWYEWIQILFYWNIYWKHFHLFQNLEIRYLFIFQKVYYLAALNFVITEALISFFHVLKLSLISIVFIKYYYILREVVFLLTYAIFWNLNISSFHLSITLHFQKTNLMNILTISEQKFSKTFSKCYLIYKKIQNNILIHYVNVVTFSIAELKNVLHCYYIIWNRSSILKKKLRLLSMRISCIIKVNFDF